MRFIDVIKEKESLNGQFAVECKYQSVEINAS